MKHFIGALAMTTTLTTAPLANATPEDEATIKTIVESVGLLADRHEFDALEKLYADEFMLDYSSLSGAPAEVKSPQALMTEWASVLPGFDRTRHALSDVRTTIDGDQAAATANVEAGHWVDGAYWQVDGQYDYQLERQAGTWKIISMTFSLEDETGSRDVFGPAIEAATANPASYIQRQQTRQAVLDFLTGLEEKDMEKVNGVWADDAVQHMPYVPDGWSHKVIGKEGLIAQYAGWPEAAGKATFTDKIIFYPMADPQTVYVEFKGVVDIIPTGRTYRQTYGSLFHVENGKITLYREYFDPREFERAFGLAN
ncbi:MAG: nuclear transport factor 2 family protein [Pseudomonadota bacterium]